MKAIISILVLGCILTISCNPKKSSPEVKAGDSVSQNEVSTSPKEILLIYEGMVPCADCEGIQITLQLNTLKNRFEEKRVYLGKGKNEFVKEGNFNTERGFGNDNDATVFILNWDKPQSEQSYYMYNSNDTETLHVLSPAKKLIDSAMDYTLKKKII